VWFWDLIFCITKCTHILQKEFKLKNTEYNKNINFSTCAHFHLCHFVSFDSVGCQSSNTWQMKQFSIGF
jgi:hypothetical protein